MLSEFRFSSYRGTDSSVCLPYKFSTHAVKICKLIKNGEINSYFSILHTDKELDQWFKTILVNKEKF